MRRLLLTLLIALVGWLPLQAQSGASSLIGAQIIGYFKTLNLNQTNTDNAVTVSAPKYIVRRIIITNASTSLAASAATLGVFTATGGGGTTVVAASLLTALSAATKYSDLTIAVTADTVASATLYLRNGIAHGSAATADVYIFGDPLP